MDVRTRVVKLDNGGIVALSEYGDPQGRAGFLLSWLAQLADHGRADS